jgi:hypothetical protein
MCCFVYEPILAPGFSSQYTRVIGHGAIAEVIVVVREDHFSFGTVRSGRDVPCPWSDGTTSFSWTSIFAEEKLLLGSQSVQKSDYHRSAPDCRISPPLSVQELSTLYLSFDPKSLVTMSVPNLKYTSPDHKVSNNGYSSDDI